MQYVRAVFNYANKFYGLPAVDHVLKPLKRPREIQEEQQVWTIEEFNTFLKYVEIYKKFFIFLFGQDAGVVKPWLCTTTI